MNESTVDASSVRSSHSSKSVTAAAHPTYRPDIDGLRAFAVLSVVVFHASSWLPGGFIGVDVFFVISGYLITTIIVDNLGVGRFSFIDFYSRRIKRILPALVVVLATVWIMGWTFGYPEDFARLGKHLLGGATFVSNFLLRGESGYFDAAAETKPLLHLWSLAIEEQFYVFWPLLLVLAIRQSRSLQVAIGVTVTVALASFAFGIAIIDTHPIEAFFSPWSRFWELMAGGLLASAAIVRPAWFARSSNGRSSLGFLFLFAALAWLDGKTQYPGWRALVPTIGAVLIISAGSGAIPNRLLLSNRLAIWFGKVSYPLYLWHWPALSFIALSPTLQANRTAKVMALTTCIFLSWLTYRYVETPVRTSRWSPRLLSIGLMSLLTTVGVIGYATYLAKGFPHRMEERVAYEAAFVNSLPDRAYSARHDLERAFREDCNFYDLDRWRARQSTNTPRESIAEDCVTRKPGTTSAVFVWGDSHAQHLLPGLQEALPPTVSLLQVASSGCAPNLIAVGPTTQQYCSKSNAVALAAIRKEKPDIVVIAQRDGHQLARLREMAVALKQDGVKEVVVIGPVPQWRPELYRIVLAEYWSATPDRLARHLDAQVEALARSLPRQMTADEPFVFIDLFGALCDAQGCRIVLDGDREQGLITYDYGHFTPRASRFVARTVIVPQLNRLMGRSS